MSKYAQLYCSRYVEVPLLSYAEYQKLPNLASQMKREGVKVGVCVEIMISKISYVIDTARGIVVQGSGSTQNGINLIKQRFLINVSGDDQGELVEVRS